MGHSKAPHKMPPTRSRLEALYSDVVQQLEQLQFTNLRKTARRYFQSTEVKGWIRFNRRKSTKTNLSTPRTDAKVQERLKQPHKPPNLPKHNRHGLPLHSVNSECQAFPKYWNQNMGSRRERNLLNRSKKQERASEVAVKPSCISSAESATSSNMKVERLGNDTGNSRRYESPSRVYQSSSEIGRFRKSIETMNTNRSFSEARTTVGCENLAITRRSSKDGLQSQPPTSIGTESSNPISHIRNLQNSYEGASPLPINKLKTRPASMTLRRQFNSNSLMEGVKSQRALDARLGYRKRECLNAQDVNAPVAIVILRSNNNQPSVSSRNTNENTTRALRNEDTIQKSRNFNTCSEAPTSCYLLGKKVEIQKEVDCNGAKAARDRIGSERPISRATLDSSLAQKCCPLATANRTTAILQDALEALECAHRWNEWGARTLHELARASKAAAERKHLLLGWSCKHERKDSNQKPELLLPHDNDVTMHTRRGRVLESREEERVFIRDLLVASGITNGDCVDKHHLLNARLHDISPTQTTPYRLIAEDGSVSFERRSAAAERRNKTKLLEKRILYDFVEELLRHEFEFRKCTQLRMNLAQSIPEHEREGQALAQRVWNHLQICPFPASDDTCTIVQNILQRDLKSQGSTWVEMAEVMEELDKLIYQDLMQELLEELTTATSK